MIFLSSSALPASRELNVITQNVQQAQPFIATAGNHGDANVIVKQTDKQITTPATIPSFRSPEHEIHVPDHVVRQGYLQNAPNEPAIFKLFDQTQAENQNVNVAESAVVVTTSSDLHDAANVDTAEPMGSIEPVNGAQHQEGSNYFHNDADAQHQNMELTTQDYAENEDHHFETAEEVSFQYDTNQQPVVETKTEIEGGIVTTEQFGSTVQVKIEAKKYVEEMKKKRKSKYWKSLSTASCLRYS